MADRIGINEPTPLVVIRQGAVRVSSATVIHRSERMALVDIDCDTKYGRLCASHGDDGARLHLDTSPESLHLHPTETGWTEIELPEFKGWVVPLHDYQMRYSGNVLLVREDARG